MKQGRRGHSAEEAKPETHQKVFKQGFVQRKGLIFTCTSLHGGSPRKWHRHQADPHVGTFYFTSASPAVACLALSGK